MRAMLAGLFLIGCGKDEEPVPEPLDLPADLAADGVPVGVRTETWRGLEVEVWYPASDAAKGAPEVLDFRDQMPQSVRDALGDIEVPAIPTRAIRDAPVRLTEQPYPVLIFSHGFGGNRVQSPDLTVHLASRGYVVLATDHSGRSLGDLLPCLFSPPLDGCGLAGFGEDPAPPDVEALVDYAASAANKGFLEGAIDPETLGIFGHSAGGMTTATMLDTDPRFLAGVPMAGSGPITRGVPSMVLAGDCDGIVTYDGLESSVEQSVDTALLTIEGAGHLAFSDLCTLDLGGLAEEHLSGRDDVNQLFLDQLLGLGTDGCPGYTPAVPECEAWLPLEVSTPIIRHYATAVFDDVLYGSGPGFTDAGFAEAILAR